MKKILSITVAVILAATVIGVVAACDKDCPCNRDNPGSCKCSPGHRSDNCCCGDNCPCSALAQKVNLFRNRVKISSDNARLLHAQQIALKSNKSLCVWVNQDCSPCRAKLPEFVHVCVGQYIGDNGLETDPKVVVLTPDGKGAMKVATRVNNCPEDLVSRVKASVAKKKFDCDGNCPNCPNCSNGTCPNCPNGRCPTTRPAPRFYAPRACPSCRG